MNPAEILAEIMETVIDAIRDMKLAGLADYGRMRLSDKELDQMYAVWGQALADRRVRADSIKPAAARFIARGGDFPSAGEFATVCEEWRSQNFEFVGLDLPDGRLKLIEVRRGTPKAEIEAIKARERRALGLPEPAPALPEPTVPMDEARNKMAETLKGVGRIV